MTSTHHKGSFGGDTWHDDKGHLHREDGPAIIGIDGSRSWYRNGLRHRDDGPAFIDEDGFARWYIRDKHISFEVNSWIVDTDVNRNWKEWTDAEDDVMGPNIGGMRTDMFIAKTVPP